MGSFRKKWNWHHRRTASSPFRGRMAKHFVKHGIEDVRVVGHALESVSDAEPFSERMGFLFVGAIHEEASPNGDSVIWFLEQILPKIQAVARDQHSGNDRRRQQFGTNPPPRRPSRLR